MFIVEGNTGVGKTTFCKLVDQMAPEIDIALEPLHNWDDEGKGASLLEKFLDDQKRWAYTMETLTMITRAKEHIREQAQKNPRRILERSIYSGYYCFAQNGYKAGTLSELEWKMYNQWADILLRTACKPPKGFIYLRAEPQVCHARIAKRGRESEKGHSLAYAKELHYWHEKFLIDRDIPFEQIKDVPVLVLDCNEEFASDPEKMKTFVEQIKQFMESSLACSSSKETSEPASQPSAAK